MSDRKEATGSKKSRGRGLRRFGADSLVLVAMLAVIFALTMVVVWPLWMLATKATPIYTFLCLLSLAAVLVTFVISRINAKKKASSL